MKNQVKRHLLALSQAALLAAMGAQAAHASTESEPIVQAAVGQQNENYTPPQSTNNTITIITGVTPGWKKPLFGCFPACNEPNTPLSVKYPDAPAIEIDIMQRMPEKFFYVPYDAKRITEAQYKHEINIKTVHIGSAQDYQKYLAENNAAAAAQAGRDMANAAVFLLTLGKIDPSQGNTQIKSINEKHVANLPPNAKKILVTQIHFKPHGYQVLETMSVAYDDIEDSELRKINYEQGIKRAISLAE